MDTVHKPKISATQLILLVAGSAIMLPYTFMPMLRLNSASQNVWLSALLSVFYIVLFNAPLLFLMIKFKGLSLTQVFKIITGSVLAKIITCVYVLALFLNFMFFILIVLQFASSVLLIETPVWALLIILLLPVTYAAVKGGGVIAKIAVYIIPLLIISIVLFLLFGLNLTDVRNLMPVAGGGSFANIHMTALLMGAQSADVVIFFIFGYYLNKKANIVKSYAVTVATAVAVSLLIFIPVVAALGFSYASKTLNPYYTFASQVRVYRGLEKLQALTQLAALPASLLKLSAYSFAASHLLNSVFPKVKAKFFALAVSLVAFILCLMPFVDKSDLTLLFITSNAFLYTTLAVSAAIPLLLILVYLLRKKKVDKKLGDEINN
jgi:spore germination protein KB